MFYTYEGIWKIAADLKQGDEILSFDGQAKKSYFCKGINDFSNGLMSARLNGKAGFIDINGEVKIDFKFADVGPFSEGLAIASIDGEKYGYIDKTGEFIIESQ